MTICNFQVKIIIWIFEYVANDQEIYFPEKLNIHYIGTAQVFFIAYVLLFSIVIMNLLIGLSVSDIADLKEKAQKASIISQIKMINGLMHLRTTVVYRYCVPSNIQKIFER